MLKPKTIYAQSLCLLVLVCLSVTETGAAPSKQDLDTFNKLMAKMSPEAGVYLDKKIKAGKDLAQWYELQSIWLMRQITHPYNAAFQAARSAAREEPKNTHILVTYAMSLEKFGKHEAAQEFVDRVLKTDPKNARALAVQALLLALSNTDEEVSKEAMRTAIKLAPKDSDVNYYAYHFYQKSFDFEESKKALDRWTEACPKDGFVHMLRAELFRRARNRDEAIKECKIALSINPDFPWAHYVLICVYFDKQDYKQTIDAATRYFGNNELEHEYELMARRGEAYAHLNQDDKAITDFTTALKILQPDNSTDKFSRTLNQAPDKYKRNYIQHWITRSSLYLKVGKTQRACDDLTQLLKIYPLNLGALQMRIRVYEKLGKNVLALKDLNLLIEKDSDIAEWYKIKARVLRKMGRETDAVAAEKRMKDVSTFGTR